MRADRAGRLHAAVDRQAGEQVRVEPQSDGSYLAGAPDTTRPVKTLTAGVVQIPKSVRTDGAGAHTGHNADLRLVTYVVTFTTTALPCGLTRGDHIVLLDAQRGGKVLKVNSVDPFGTGRTQARCDLLPPAAA